MVTTFLTLDDYLAVCEPDTINLLSQFSEEVRHRAERYAMEQAASYLRSRYDMEAAFAAAGNDRNAQLVMVTADIACYHLCSSLPRRQGHEIRQERYELAVKWLENAQSGMCMPALPPLTAADGSDMGNPIRFGSLPKQTYDW
jgi:phage gp36-like protein